MNERTPAGVVSQMFEYLSWGSLCVVAQTCTKWRDLSRAQKAFWIKKLKEEKGISFDAALFPPGFLEAHPIDYRALYLKIRNIPAHKIFNPSAFAHYSGFVVLSSLLGGQTFWDALALEGRPAHFPASAPATSYYIAGSFAISGDLESLKKFDEGSLSAREIILEGAIKGGAIPTLEWILDQIDEYKEDYLKQCFGWAIEYRQRAVLDLLETKYGQGEPVVEGQPWYCLDKAICSDSIPLVDRFSMGQKLPPYFLHLAAQQNATQVFWYGVKVLKLNINQLDRNGLMPIHHIAQNANVPFFQQVAEHPDCCLMLKNPECRSVENQVAYIHLLKIAAHESSAVMIWLLHTQYPVDLSVILPETGNTLAHECCMPSRIKVFRYLIRNVDLDWAHVNKEGKTVSQLRKLENEGHSMYVNDNNFYYYVLNAHVTEFLIKALSKDDDAKEFLVKLMQYHMNYPGDIMACLALAIVYREDDVLCQQYLRRGLEISPQEYDSSIDIMNRLALMMSNVATIDTSCLKKQSRCCVM